MATKTKKKRVGKVGITPRGNWSSTYNSGNGYAILDLVLHNNDSWVSKTNGNTDTPSTSSAKWQKHSGGGAEAMAAATTANTAASNANTKAGLANTAAQNADTATARANDAAGRTETAIKQAGRVNASMVDYDLKVTDKNGNTTSTNVKGDKGEGINYATMSTAEKNELAAKVIQQICSQNVIGPTYDASKRCIVYSITNGVSYDENNRCIKLG